MKQEDERVYGNLKDIDWTKQGVKCCNEERVGFLIFKEKPIFKTDENELQIIGLMEDIAYNRVGDLYKNEMNSCIPNCEDWEWEVMDLKDIEKEMILLKLGGNEKSD